eukprot:gene587-8095_t
MSKKFGGVSFEVSNRYSDLKVIGEGSYGVVVSAFDNEKKQNVAIKKIVGVFDRDLLFSKRILREIKILHHFEHENIIRLLDLQKPKSYQEFKDVYIVTDLMDSDLSSIINSEQPLSDEHVQFFLYQILSAIKYIHSADVLHRDLKPSNILINKNCEIKICDLGLARGNVEETNEYMTEYVVTRWYRAPELVLSKSKYSKPLDLWSVGCILAELIGRKPIFQGQSYVDQIAKIISLRGTPTIKQLQDLELSPDAYKYLTSLPFVKKTPLKKIYKNANPNALDLLDKLLDWSPKSRFTVEEALDHEYLKELHDPEDEPMCDSKMDFTFEKDIKTEEDVKRLIFEEILSMHPEDKELSTQIFEKQNENLGVEFDLEFDEMIEEL